MKIPQDGAQWREISFNELAAERFIQSQWSKKQSCRESQELSIGIKHDQIKVKFTILDRSKLKVKTNEQRNA